VSLDIHTTYTGRTAYSAALTEALPTADFSQYTNANDNVGLYANWVRRVETLAGITMALLVVAFVALLMGMPGQPRDGYRATFNSIEACQKTRVDLVAERERLRAEEEQQAAQMRGVGAFIHLYSVLPSVTQGCAAR
jgi:hypothetical protein